MNADGKTDTTEGLQSVQGKAINHNQANGPKHISTVEGPNTVKSRYVPDKQSLTASRTLPTVALQKTVAAIIAAAVADSSNARSETTTTEKPNPPERKAPEETFLATKAHALSRSDAKRPIWLRGQTILGFTNEEIRIGSSSSSELQVRGHADPWLTSRASYMHRAGNEHPVRPVQEAFRTNGTPSHQDGSRPVVSAKKKPKNLCDKCIAAMQADCTVAVEPSARSSADAVNHRRPAEAKTSTSLLQKHTRKLFSRRKKAVKQTVSGFVTSQSRFEDIYEGSKGEAADKEQKQRCSENRDANEKGTTVHVDNGAVTTQLRSKLTDYKTTKVSHDKRNIFRQISGLQRSKFGSLKISDVKCRSVEATAPPFHVPTCSNIQDNRSSQVVANNLPQPVTAKAPGCVDSREIIGCCSTYVGTPLGTSSKSIGIPNAPTASTVGFTLNPAMLKPISILTAKPKNIVKLMKKTPKASKKSPKTCKKVTFSADIDVFSFCAADSILESFYGSPELKDRSCLPNLFHCFPAMCGLPEVDVDVARNVFGGRKSTFRQDGTAFTLDLKGESKIGPECSLMVNYNASSGKFELVGFADVKTNSGDCGSPTEIKAASWIQPGECGSESRVTFQRSGVSGKANQEKCKPKNQTNLERTESELIEISCSVVNKTSSKQALSLDSINSSKSFESKGSSLSLNLLEDDPVLEAPKKSSDESINEDFHLCPLMAASASDSNKPLHKPEAKKDAVSPSDFNDTHQLEALKQTEANAENGQENPPYYVIAKACSQSEFTVVDYSGISKAVERLNGNSSFVESVSTEGTSAECKGEAKGLLEASPKALSSEDVELHRQKVGNTRLLHLTIDRSEQVFVEKHPAPSTLPQDVAEAIFKHELGPFQSTPRVSKSECFIPYAAKAENLHKDSRNVSTLSEPCGSDQDVCTGQATLRASYSESNVSTRLQKEKWSGIPGKGDRVERGNDARPAADNAALGKASWLRLPTENERVFVHDCEDTDSCEDEDAILLPEKRIRLGKQLSRSLSGIFKRFDLDAGKKQKVPGKKDKKR